MATPIEILYSVDILCPGDQVLLKKNKVKATVSMVIVSSDGLKIRIQEDSFIYREHEYTKIANSNGVRKTFWIIK